MENKIKEYRRFFTGRGVPILSSRHIKHNDSLMSLVRLIYKNAYVLRVKDTDNLLTILDGEKDTIDEDDIIDAALFTAAFSKEFIFVSKKTPCGSWEMNCSYS
jgi:predicted ribosome quality control (RQC) complex YloA/Tae2 family protein